jgi:hypothetical protein
MSKIFNIIYHLVLILNIIVGFYPHLSIFNLIVALTMIIIKIKY